MSLFHLISFWGFLFSFQLGLFFFCLPSLGHFFCLFLLLHCSDLTPCLHGVALYSSSVGLSCVVSLISWAGCCRDALDSVHVGFCCCIWALIIDSSLVAGWLRFTTPTPSCMAVAGSTKQNRTKLTPAKILPITSAILTANEWRLISVERGYKYYNIGKNNVRWLKGRKRILGREGGGEIIGVGKRNKAKKGRKQNLICKLKRKGRWQNGVRKRKSIIWVWNKIKR